MNYPRGKFGDCSFIRFGFIMLTNMQTPELEPGHAVKLTRDPTRPAVGVVTFCTARGER